MNPSLRHFVLWRRLLFSVAVLSFSSLQAGEPVRVQLKWLHQFQFAGYYAALEQGYYKEAGLAVELIEGTPEVDPVEVVLSGDADYGVATPELLLAHAAGKQVVVLGVIFQHSPYVFLVLRDGEIQSIDQLDGKRVMVEPQAAELYAYLQRERVDKNRLDILPHSFSANDLLDGQVDAMSAYSTDEPYTLEEKGVEYSAFSPRSGGVDFYGDCFFTTERELREHPERVRAFRAATLRGWDYAFDHPEEIIELLTAKYDCQKSPEALRFEAEQMRKLIHPELIPIGYMYPGRWNHIKETYEELGMLKTPVNLDKFLYNPEPRLDLTVLYWAAGGTLVSAVGFFGILLPIWKLNRRLRAEIVERVEAENLLREARDAVLEASRVKMEFLTHISHDLRTPVSSIVMLAESMSDRSMSPADREDLRLIEEASQHLLDLINDLLDMKQLESGYLELNDQPIVLADVVNPVVEVMEVAARRKGLLLVQTGDDLTISGLGDAHRLRQILFNLIGNAVKFTDQGKVEICIRKRENNWLAFEVSDTGPGISETEQRRIFDPFSRINSERTRGKEGHGVGLAIVRRLAEAMGGRIHVRSTPGEGSTFTLEIPFLPISSQTTPIAK